jgi:hypothetical protein
VLDAEQNATIHEALRRQDARYEEDLEWNIVALFFPEAFPDIVPEQVRATLINSFPDEMRAAGFEVSEETSRTLRERAFYAQHKGKFQVRTAWGSWHGVVPQGMVLVRAERGDGFPPFDRVRNGVYGVSTGEEAYFLVPKAEYGVGGRGQNPFTFVIDEARHQRADENGRVLEVGAVA